MEHDFPKWSKKQIYIDVNQQDSFGGQHIIFCGTGFDCNMKILLYKSRLF